MRTKILVKTGATSFALLLISACWGDSTVAGNANSAYKKPSDWASECVGRLLIDVPAPINFGDAIEDGYRINDLADHGTGNMRISNAIVYESKSLPRRKKTDELDFEWIKKATAASYLYLSRNKNEATKAFIQKTTKQITTPETDATAWISSNDFDIVFYRDTDNRVRRFTGHIDDAEGSDRTNNVAASLSAQKTAAQAQRVIDKVWPRYQVRKPGDLPKEAGICTPYGFFVDPPGVTEQDYSFKMPLRDPRYSNLALSIAVGTRPTLKPAEDGEAAEALKIEDIPTPWQIEDKQSKEEKAKCRPQQGGASRDIFGCMFTGSKNIKKHRDVEYLTLANGQKARLIVLEYSTSLSGGVPYTDKLETAGVPNSAKEPRIVISATAYNKDAEEEAFKGKNPPTIDQAVELVRTLAQSLRPRPGGLVEDAALKDVLQGVR